ncbi:hypothetical protein CRE_05342 [Caenorhabditis remanei]|uniref:Cortactin-binding protein-2 N-terminal domain-containing protein n=1 Tax=Caenorhabditis remanei TaxID=31234 RepID=E3NSI9_CAERE|nr:hypothetical protein CRE_05342 [Caenorhabditis remanei]
MPNLLEDNFDPTFQSTSKKLVLPPNRKNHAEYDNLNEEPRVNDFSSDELMKLLSFMEGEVQAREDVIDHLKKERTKILLSEAKYGKLNMNDPFAALRRDSAITDEQIDEEKIVQMYESQVDQLDKMMSVQKKSQRNAAVLLVALEKKQYKLVKKLESDREAKIRYAKQGDDLVAHLEKERNQLQQQIEFHIEEKRKAEIAKDKMEMTLGNEKKRHESIVLYLIQERKQMLLKMHELRVKAEQLMLQNQSDPNKRELHQLPQLTPDVGSLVMANRGAKSVTTPRPPTAPPAARIPNSSTFPTEKSRLPRAPPPISTAPAPRMSIGNLPSSSSNP